MTFPEQKAIDEISYTLLWIKIPHRFFKQINPHAGKV